jgi:prefoldin subunit 5
MISLNYEKYSEFITSTLEPKLKQLVQDRESFVDEIESYEENIYILTQYSQDKISGKQPIIRKLVDVGCGVACQAESGSTDTVFINVGMDNFIELPLDKAVGVSKERQIIIASKIELLDKDISECVGDIEGTLTILAELKKLEPTSNA